MSEPNRVEAVPTSQPKQRRIGARQIVALVFLAVLVVFIAANTQKVKVNFLVKTVHAPMFEVLIATAVLGALITLLVQFRRRRRGDRG